jgi:uncharacterized membrane protein
MTTTDASLELAIGRILKIGVVASSVTLAAGLLVTTAHGPVRLAHDLLTTGIVVLLATPAARVVVSVVDYARERDWTFVGLTVIVLLELVASVVAAILGLPGP